MPALFLAIFNALVSLAVSVGSKLALFAARRLPVIIAATALLVAIATAYILSMKSLALSLQQTIPDVVIQVWTWVMPGNAIPCLMAVLTARLIRWSYQRYEKLVVFKAKSVMS
ncbi:DUF5455 family protein [Methylomonas sp. MS20]|uniref:DUF5455 family protein n=1 Tax=unclassified Methylomonas TaxID=2608980 RepID=UPI0028A54B84|nr:DUF5455 family protein [Methylomonas sp. MV1]MDT4328327.1 DUF5455 family protein [Methylomonas sp. MV1]